MSVENFFRKRNRKISQELPKHCRTAATSMQQGQSKRSTWSRGPQAVLKYSCLGNTLREIGLEVQDLSRAPCQRRQLEGAPFQDQPAHKKKGASEAIGIAINCGDWQGAQAMMPKSQQNLPAGGGTRYRTHTAPMQSEPSLPLRLALIGMSGAGKTFWAKKLAAEGWTALSCDDRIEEKLASRLAAGGHTGIKGVAAWMGWPDSAMYAEREAQYLEEEIHTLGEVLTGLEREKEKPLVLDTTGSVIYTGNN